MKKVYYMCDGGSVAVATKNNDVILYSNGYGDCSGEIYELTQEEFEQFKNKSNVYFINTAIFNDATVLDYDCIDKIDDIKSHLTDIVLNGKYAIYNHCFDLFFVKLEDVLK